MNDLSADCSGDNFNHKLLQTHTTASFKLRWMQKLSQTANMVDINPFIFQGTGSLKLSLEFAGNRLLNFLLRLLGLR